MTGHYSIWKFPLKVEDFQTIGLPAEHDILCIKTQNDEPVLYARVSTDCEAKLYYGIRCVGTGHNFDDYGMENYKYIDTTMMCNDLLVLHWFIKQQRP